MLTHTAAPARPDAAGAVRFLAQAGWGAAPADIPALTATGFEPWLRAQRAQPVSLTRPYLDEIDADVRAHPDAAPASVPYARAQKPFTLAANFTTIWMRNVINGPDQLRQRVAFALSQLLVTSYNGVNDLAHHAPSIAGYYDLLAEHALGNFRDLLFEASTHPVMAHYLSSLGNEKADPASNQYPDENFAREVMQLFTIGLWELDPAGELRKDAVGHPIPTYDTRDVEELARVFTGLWFAGRRWPLEPGKFPRFWLAEGGLAMFEARHDQGPKTLFHGKPWQAALPANNGGFNDIAAALDALFNHPNTAPFVSRSLIKALVTSNPSPAYVKRVAAVFARNSAGLRGDLFATVSAILLDDEARGDPLLTGAQQGKLQEPMLRLTRLVRAFRAGVDTPDLQFWGHAIYNNFGELPLYSPSVFNFFAPGYRHLGALAAHGLTSPEFQILNAATIAQTSNRLAQYIDTVLQPRAAGGTPLFAFDFSSEHALAGDPNTLLDRLAMLLTNNRLRTETRARILSALASLPAADLDGRVRLAVWLVAVCPEAAII